MGAFGVPIDLLPLYGNVMKTYIHFLNNQIMSKIILVRPGDIETGKQQLLTVSAERQMQSLGKKLLAFTQGAPDTHIIPLSDGRVTQSADILGAVLHLEPYGLGELPNDFVSNSIDPFSVLAERNAAVIVIGTKDEAYALVERFSHIVHIPTGPFKKGSAVVIDIETKKHELVSA